MSEFNKAGQGDDKELDFTEEYLGGFSSPHLVRGIVRGYELHATNKRLIGVKNRKVGTGWMLAVGGGGAIGGAIAGKMTKDQKNKTIRELNNAKDFAVDKGQISKIEIKKPGTLTRGHIVILQKSGEKIEVKIADKTSYQQSLSLLQAFFPEVLITT